MLLRPRGRRGEVLCAAEAEMGRGEEGGSLCAIGGKGVVLTIMGLLKSDMRPAPAAKLRPPSSS